jgi:DNA-binding winged helix-turn-helix (wHTH) protein
MLDPGHADRAFDNLGAADLAEHSQTAPPSVGPITFGDFTAVPSARTLLRDGSPVGLGGRAFDLLMALLEARGQIVSKAAIMQRVWPEIAVEETNLRVQLSRLRQALGGERWRIKTIQCRGYLLVQDTPVGWDAQAPARPKEPAVVVIDMDSERGEQLWRLLAQAGVRVEGLASLAGLFQTAAREQEGRR